MNVDYNKIIRYKIICIILYIDKIQIHIYHQQIYLIHTQQHVYFFINLSNFLYTLLELLAYSVSVAWSNPRRTVQVHR